MIASAKNIVEQFLWRRIAAFANAKNNRDRLKSAAMIPVNVRKRTRVL
jgi:hypothetical protein